MDRFDCIIFKFEPYQLFHVLEIPLDLLCNSHASILGRIKYEPPQCCVPRKYYMLLHVNNIVQ